MCGVDLTTVINWVKKGKMKAYRTAGGHRRIKAEDLREFMEHYSMPIPPELLESDKHRVLTVSSDPRLEDTVKNSTVKMVGDFEISLVSDVFEAGYEYASFKPDVMLIDLTAGGNINDKMIRKVSRKEDGTKIIAIVGEGTDKDGEYRIIKNGAIALLRKPFSVDDLVEAIERVVS